MDSDEDVNGGDAEDNFDTKSWSSKSLEDIEQEEEEFNLNVSFSGGYIPNTDL